MNPALRVLVVDDDRLCRTTTAQQLGAAGYVVEAAESAVGALEIVEARPWDVVLSDLRMPRMDGLTFLREVKRRLPDTDVILMTAYGTVESAVSAMHEGAADYLTKPFRFPELDLRLRRLGEARVARQQLSRLRGLLDPAGASGLVGRSQAMRHLHERLASFAPHPAPVLVTGETGTGKELVARALHDLGPRRAGRFVPVACGAVPRELAESFFLGHEKGAFTGATQRRKGCFEQANGGTLLLDDVDDLAIDLQVKLLRVLQEGVLNRVGGDEDVPIDVRVVATTKVDLARAVEERAFRSDLYYRLRGLEISLPPLRERGDDVILLADHFLRILASEGSRAPATLSDEVVPLLRSWRWPGNVRELRRAMEAADALAGGAEIRAEHLPPRPTPADGATPRVYSLHLDGVARLRMSEVVAQVEEELVAWAMRSAQGQQTRAAEMLGLPRTTLQSKLGKPDSGH